MKIYLIRAFTKDGQGGNLAGVVLDADGLDEKEMQDIATKVNVSETAFLQKSDKANFKVRFFTPTAEVDLCGHATIATFSLLAKKLSPGIYTQETKAGILNVEITLDGVIFMDQAVPEFLDMLDSTAIAKVLNIPDQWIINTKLKPQVVSTGLKDIMIPIDTREHLLEIKPDFKSITDMSKEHDVVGLHVFTLDTIQPEATAHARNFAPLYGINEESATGTSNGALACYLFENEKLTPSDHYIFEQGYNMDQPSEIYAKLENKNNIRVKIGGRAVIDKEIEV